MHLAIHTYERKERVYIATFHSSVSRSDSNEKYAGPSLASGRLKVSEECIGLKNVDSRQVGAHSPTAADRLQMLSQVYPVVPDHGSVKIGYGSKHGFCASSVIILANECSSLIAHHFLPHVDSGVERGAGHVSASHAAVVTCRGEAATASTAAAEGSHPAAGTARALQRSCHVSFSCVLVR